MHAPPGYAIPRSTESSLLTKLLDYPGQFAQAAIDPKRRGRIRGRLVRSLLIRRYFDRHPVRKVQIGCGSNILPGWLNTDIDPGRPDVVYQDATKRFTFATASVDYLFSEHVIEHLSYRQGLWMLAECLRVLRPGGKLRLATPDLERFTHLFAAEQTDLQSCYVRWIVDTYVAEPRIHNACFAINNVFRNWDHQFIYDRSTLEHALHSAGFVNVTFRACGESDDQMLRGLEQHGQILGAVDMMAYETMVVEAARPNPHSMPRSYPAALLQVEGITGGA